MTKSLQHTYIYMSATCSFADECNVQYIVF